MKKSFPIIFAFAIIFLFFVQSAGTLVESIYILDLMNLNLDTKVLGLLFFFAPVLLIPFFKKFRAPLIWITFALLLLSRGLLPYLDTANRMLASGIATTAVISLFLLMLPAQPAEQPYLGPDFGHPPGWRWPSACLFCYAPFTLAWIIPSPGRRMERDSPGLLLGAVLTQLESGSAPQEERKPAGVTTAILGLFLVLTLIYFAFSAPSVISRWTEANYTLIVLAVSLLAAAWIMLALLRPHLLRNIDRRLLLAGNLVFTLCLTGTILVHGVPFRPPLPPPP